MEVTDRPQEQAVCLDEKKSFGDTTDTENVMLKLHSNIFFKHKVLIR